MAKLRVHELAKELNLETKEVLSRLQALGSEAKNHMSMVEEQHYKALKESLSVAKSTKTAKGKAPQAEEVAFVPQVKRIRKTDLIPAESDALNLEEKQKADEKTSAGKEGSTLSKLSAGSQEPTEVPENKIIEKEDSVPSATGKQPEQKTGSLETAKPVVKPQPLKETVPAAPQNISVPKDDITTQTPAVTATPPATANKPSVNTGTPSAATTTQPRAYAPSQGQDNRPPRPTGGYQGQDNRPPRPAGGYQGQDNRPPRPAGGYQGQDNRPPRPAGGYQGQDNRPPRPAGGYQGQDNRPPRPAGGYQGQDNRGVRPAGGYQGQDNRPPRPAGGYQGQDNRGARPAGGYQGQDNRPPRPAGGYQGQDNRPPRPAGGYQGQDNRGARPAGGYQGQDNRGARPAGGYQGQDNRDARPAGSFQGHNSRTRNGAGTGAGTGAGKFTTPVVEKPTSRRPDKKLFKEIYEERNESFGEDGGGKRSNKIPFRGERVKKNKNLAPKKAMPPVVPKKVVIGETVILQDLAKSMGKTAAEIIKKLFEMGVMATINQELDAETAILLAGEYGITVEVAADKALEIMEDMEDAEATLVERPPVVTVMGHVDHGKTSLLDAIRKTNVIATEAGGITQHIGAYQVEINNKKITFLDTPGHEAFTSMRARGAQVTDVAVLVVAADDGVMPQTIEAINHAKAAKVPIIVAINKIDKPNANPDKVKQELMEYGLVSEEWGGETIMVPIAAKTGQNISKILEMILLVAEVGELKANPKRKARGTIIESQLDKGRGPVATLLVQKGTLRIGDNILAGAVYGKVRGMLDDKGRSVKAAGPSMPVEVIGFSEVPPPGEIFIVAKDEKDAKMVAGKQQAKKREGELRKSSKISLEDLFTHIAEGEIKELNLIIKADVQGSEEALKQSLLNLNNDEVKVNIIHSGVGAINESDVMLATASTAIIIGFNVRPSVNASKLAESEQVDIRTYRVIYDAIEDVKKAMVGLLDPELKEVVIGHAEVRALIKVPKAGMVAGSYITDGKITRQAQVRVLRNGIVVAEDKVDSLKRFKDDVKEVLSGFECGISLQNFSDFKEADILEAFIMEEVTRDLK